jgi:hypothetical protein
MFGEKDVFLAIFNPLYFIEVLGDKGRNLLERYLPAIAAETVLANLSEDTRETLADADLSSPETFLDNIRATIRDNEKTITYTEGQRDLLGSQDLETHTALNQKETALAELDAEMLDLETRRTVGIDFDALDEKRTDLYARFSESNADKSAANELARVTAAYETAKARYAREGKTYKKLRPGVQCPTCKQQIMENNIESIKESFKESMLAARDEGAKQAQRLSELQQEETESGEERADIKAQIQSVEADIEFGGLTPDEKWRLDDLAKEAETLRIEIATLNKALSVTQGDKVDEIDTLRSRVSEDRNLESAVKYYLEERANLTFSGFNMLKRVKILLYDTVKTTGEAKSVFRFSYDGRPYKFLSLSEKIKAGLEISELLKKLTDRTYPVFIDNGESIPVIDNVRPTGQMFIAQVVKNAPLEVKTQSVAPQKAAA